MIVLAMIRLMLRRLGSRRIRYCYLPLYVFYGRHLIVSKLRRSNIDAAAGSVTEMARIIGQIRRRWPRVRILLRADSVDQHGDVALSQFWCSSGIF